MNFYVSDIQKDSLENSNFRKVLNTSAHSQLVVMSLMPKEDIGMETHPEVDQFIRIEQGRGQAILNGEVYEIEAEYAVVIPAGTEHNIVNTSDTEAMKLYTIYSPANHPEGTIHRTKEEAQAAEHEYE
jgi:mannose-6-phosphate isomerase-like protein (cupin superfamily)